MTEERVRSLLEAVARLEREAAEHLAARSRSARLLDAIFAAGLDPRNPPRVEPHEAPETAYARAVVARLHVVAAAEAAAYARGALDMRTRAAAVATAARPKQPIPSGGYPGADEYDRGRDDTGEGIAEDIEALDVEVPQ